MKISKRKHDDLLKQAIADANMVREIAVENAKLALAETFVPRLQRAISTRLSEMDGEEDESAIADDELVGDEMPADDIATDDIPADDEVHEEFEGDEVSDEEDGAPDEDAVSVDDVADEMGDGSDDDAIADDGSDEVSDDEIMTDDDAEDGDEDNLDLESILRELDDDGMEDDEFSDTPVIDDEENMEPPVEEDVDSSEIGPGGEPSAVASDDSTEDPQRGQLTEEGDEEIPVEDDEDEAISIEEIIRSLREEEDMAASEEDAKSKEALEAELAATQDAVQESYAVIQYLRKQLKEVNLMNAKLMFTNKLIKAYDLNESQKMKIIDTFDRTKNLREVKLVFATLAESLRVSKKKGSVKLTETVKRGSASRTTASSRPSREVITEGDDLVARWQKLANLKKR